MITFARNTPTGVGKTRFRLADTSTREKHPHRRGEDKPTKAPPRLSTETPPQAWGRLIKLNFAAEVDRNTPTGVGKTLHDVLEFTLLKKHPHRRGEDRNRQLKKWRERETPPQAWGRHQSELRGSCLARKHPHRRGEDYLYVPCGESHGGNTPTGVGKTNELATVIAYAAETPPQAWGRRIFLARFVFVSRNTPTGVGKTSRSGTGRNTCQKHPHRRGEDSS